MCIQLFLIILLATVLISTTCKHPFCLKFWESFMQEFGKGVGKCTVAILVITSAYIVQALMMPNIVDFIGPMILKHFPF